MILIIAQLVVKFVVVKLGYGRLLKFLECFSYAHRSVLVNVHNCLARLLRAVEVCSVPVDLRSFLSSRMI